MLGTLRPQFVLFGSSIVQYSYYEGWGATLSHLYARKVIFFLHLETLMCSADLVCLGERG